MPFKNFYKISKKLSKCPMAIILVVILILPTIARATATSDNVLQSQIDTNNQQIANLNKQIAEYQLQLQKVGANKKTLQTAINDLIIQRSKIEAQISVTQRQINTTQLQIKQLGLSITNTEQSITENQKTLGKYFRNIQKADDQPIVEQMLSSQSMAEAWDDLNAILQIQNAIKNKTDDLKTQKTQLTDSQNATKQKQDVLTSQKQSLTAQQASLIATKKSKDQLLAETNAEESKYQALLATAKSQLASFTAFAKNAGGSGLLTNQTSCDAWGCYYNQRDAAWGNNSLNGTQYRLASDGCLVTSMAMVMTHYGHPNVTPETINSNPNNFAAYYPAYLLYTIYADGVTAVRKTATINATLATGNPVIVGLHAYGGTHFVVLTSGTNGNYLMRDPYIANGKDISFTSHYSLKNIYEIDKVVIN